MASRSVIRLSVTDLWVNFSNSQLGFTTTKGSGGWMDEWMSKIYKRINQKSPFGYFEPRKNCEPHNFLMGTLLKVFVVAPYGLCSRRDEVIIEGGGKQ